MMNQPGQDKEEPALPTGEPARLAMELLQKGFPKPVVIDALVAEGLAREVAREIVTSLLKARFRMRELERIEARQFQSRNCMLLGVAILVFACWWFFSSVRGNMQAPHATKAVMFVFSAGFFLFLYGFTLRKRF